MKIHLLCSGSKGNSCLIESQSTRLLIDCGSTKTWLSRQLSELQVRVEDIDAVCITHNHSDHVSQLKMFCERPLYAWCDLKFPSHKLEPGAEFAIGDLEIKVLRLSHDAGYTCGYVIRQGEQKLVYVTDTGYFPLSLLPDVSDADYYIFESNHDPAMLMGTNRPVYLKQRILSATGHLCNEEAAFILTKAVGPHTREIVLAHISQEANTPELALETFHEVFERYEIPLAGIHVQAAQQFERIDLPE